MSPTYATPRDIYDILDAMYPKRDELVPCFIGAPGIGKTQGIYQFAEDNDINVVTFILSNTVPSEVSGMRMPDAESKTMQVFDDMRMASLKDGDILFFDEILEAPPMLWSACLTLIQDRIMASGKKLPDVFIVAASNPVASPGIIPPSVRNRFQFLNVVFDFDSWSDWFFNEYHTKPSKELKQRIQCDSTTYNVLTPREITKLYEWMKVPLNKAASIVRFDTITRMFDGELASILREMAEGIKSEKGQLMDCLYELNIDLPSPSFFEALSMKEILRYLEGRGDWESIKFALETTELETGGA